MGWYRLHSFDLGQGSVADPCEHCNDPSGSIKRLEILEYLIDWRLLKKGSAPRSYISEDVYKKGEHNRAKRKKKTD
jgi:hypothetical protein